MSDAGLSERALDDIRVLDLTGPMGVYCGKLLADLGGDVIKVERPGGDPMRSRGPFYHDEAHPEKSLYFFHYNTSKRGVTLNMEGLDGREMFKRLVAGADVVLETYPPGYMERLGLGYTELKAINPGLIMTSITPFGQTGPYRDYKSSDLVGAAMGSLTHMTGNPGERPSWTLSELIYQHVSINASTATLIALYHRDLTGEGQYVDVSMHEAASMIDFGGKQSWDVEKELQTRRGMEVTRAASSRYQSKDGYVYMVAYVGPPINFLRRWLDEDGIEHDLWDERWQDNDFLGQPENVAHMQEILVPFFLNHTTKEIIEKGQSGDVNIVPFQDTREVVEDPQLQARGFFVEIEHPAMGGSLKDTGGPYSLSETPWHIHRRAPLIGEHNDEIYHGELGYSKEQLVLLKASGAI